MKRLLVTIILFWGAFCLAFAQMTVSPGSSNFTLQVKRCIAEGDDVCIDLVFTGNGRWDVLHFYDSCEAYDDEGNSYKGSNAYKTDTRNSIYFEYDNMTKVRFSHLSIPKDVPRKLRLRITDVDEYASSFVKISLPCDGNASSANSFVVNIKNLSITRE